MSSLRKGSGCPYCARAMETRVMECAHCDVEVRGHFRETQFAALSGEDQAFLEQYLLVGFSIKALADQSEMGYTAIRSRLDRVIANYRGLKSGEDAKLRILDRLENDEISADEAARALESLTR